MLSSPNARAVSLLVLVTVSLPACALIAGLGDYDVVANANDAATNPTNDGGTGEGGVPASIVATPTLIDFAAIRCGSAEVRKDITLQNQGDAEIAWSATLPADSAFALIGAAPDGKLSGTIGPRGSATVGIRPTGAMPGAQSVDLAIESPGAEPIRITLTANVLGAAIVATPALVDFGDVRYQNGAGPTPIVLQNTGTDPVTLTFAKTGEDFEIVPTSLAVAAGSVNAINATLKSGPSSADTLTAMITTTAGATPVCGTPPTIELRGRRVITDVTTTPGTLEFGSVNCGPNPGSKEITITNYSTEGSVNITTKLSANARFTVTAPLANLQAAADPDHPATAIISVTPTKPLMAPVGQADASLAITLTGTPIATGTQTITVPLKLKVVGGVVEWSSLVGPAQSEHDFGNVRAGDSKNGVLFLRNKGNAAVSVQYTLTSSPAFSLNEPVADTLNTSSVFPDDVAVKFTPPNAGSFETTVGMTSTSVLCAPLPTGKFKGTGTSNATGPGH